MSSLLESIKVKDGTFHQLAYHEQRMHRAQRDLCGEVTIIHLADYLSVPHYARQGLYKCRVMYRQRIERVEFIPYQPKVIRTLRRVHCDTIEYDHKYEDRSKLSELFNQRGECDDVLIIKNGLVTDTSYANIIFYDGRRWFTPAQPLLQGTQRQYLLDQGVVERAIIKKQDIHLFHRFRLINALLELKHPAQPTANII